jgi:hypothetical protein
MGGPICEALRVAFQADRKGKSLFGAELAFSYTELAYGARSTPVYTVSGNQSLFGLRLCESSRPIGRISGVSGKSRGPGITLTPRNCATHSFLLGT